MVTWRSSITSKRAAWVLAGARLISSMSTMLENMGPALNSNSEVFMLYTEVPNTSEGIRSGVNCMREKSTDMTLDISLAVSVFATPGTPSIRTWPSASNAVISNVIICSWPMLILPISSRIFSTLACRAERSTRLSNVFSSMTVFDSYYRVKSYARLLVYNESSACLSIPVRRNGWLAKPVHRGIQLDQLIGGYLSACLHAPDLREYFLHFFRGGAAAPCQGDHKVFRKFLGIQPVPGSDLLEEVSDLLFRDILMVGILQVKIADSRDEFKARIGERLDHRNDALLSFGFEEHEQQDGYDSEVVSPF